MKYRSRIEIVAKILQSASIKPISKTRLMYSTYMAYEGVTPYTAMLIENDLLNYDIHTRLFSTTPKGLKFVELYKRMQQLINLEGEEQQLYKKKGYWQNELSSLEVNPKRNSELNDPNELQNLADAIKLSICEGYKTANREENDMHREEAESTISAYY